MYHQQKCLIKRARMQRKRWCSLSAPGVTRTPGKKQKQWTDEQMIVSMSSENTLQKKMSG